MDTTNLSANYQKLLDFLEANNYQKDALWLTRRCFRLALSSNPTQSYQDVFFEEAARKGYKPTERRYKSLLTYMGNVMRFDMEGKYPDRRAHNTLLLKPSKEDGLTEEYKNILKMYCSVKQDHICGKSIYTRKKALVQLLLHFQNCGVSCLSDVTEAMVLSFFNDGVRSLRGRDYCFLVKRALQVVELYNDSKPTNTAVKNIIAWLPKIKSGDKPYPYLKRHEMDRIRAALIEDGNGLTHRDRMVGWILFFWGLRGTDIVSLRGIDVDWQGDTVSLIQSKTCQPITLPLNATIGNEIFDYITQERQPIDLHGTIIRTQRAPSHAMKSIASIIKKIFKVADVRQDEGGGNIRLMRHNMVTFLLTHGVACDVVSSLVGHKSPESLKPYADSDLEHLKECSISIEEYPMPEDYFKL